MASVTPKLNKYMVTIKTQGTVSFEVEAKDEAEALAIQACDDGEVADSHEWKYGAVKSVERRK